MNILQLRTRSWLPLVVVWEEMVRYFQLGSGMGGYLSRSGKMIGLFSLRTNNNFLTWGWISMIYLNKMNYNIYLFFDNFSKNKQSILPLFLNIQLYYYNIYILIINISVHLPVFIISGNMQSIFHRCLNYQYHNYYVYLLIIITSKDRQ